MDIKRRWPWIAHQNWEDILFIHTPVNYETLRSLVPYPFEIDTYNKTGWVSTILFQATQSRFRSMPSFLSFPSFYQMNIRTYVRFGDERGVYFFNIHTNHPLVKMGGSMAGLPFTQAPLKMEKKGRERIFEADHLFNHPQSKLHVAYEPSSQDIDMHPNSLPYFLTERYAIWMIRENTIIKAPIGHTPWKLRRANFSILHSTHMPFPYSDDTIAHYADFKHTYIHPYERIGIVSRD